jgi:holliday junction DNA helicase RuvA
MIGYLDGILLQSEDDRILLLVNQVGFEVLLPGFSLGMIRQKAPGDRIQLYIYHYQTERQPKPVLIGFETAVEKEFFQVFISVDAIGPVKAVKALSMPIDQIANAIEAKDVQTLKALKGVGQRTAQKIIAALEGRMEPFLSPATSREPATAHPPAFAQPVLEVLITQLGHKPFEARQMVAEAFKRQPSMASPEALFDEIYRGKAA